MGLRFRKSVTLFPGMRLNFGKTGMSISAGVPGFRKTFHTSGKVTTSVGIPGTGLYYVDTKGGNNTYSQDASRAGRTSNSVTTAQANAQQSQIANFEKVSYEPISSTQKTIAPQLSEDIIKSIHKSCDDSIEWTEVLVSPTPPDASYNSELWSYYHGMAPEILAGNIDAFLQLIYEINPLDDLLEYAGSFQFGTDTPTKMTVEFVVNKAPLSNIQQTYDTARYNDVLQDYICSICIRIARDVFALLPVKNVVVHAEFDNVTVISVDFDRATMSKIKFGFIDPSDTISRFDHKMEYNSYHGLIEVNRLD